MKSQEMPPGTPVVVDIGEAFCKVGFAGEMEPREIFPHIVGREKYKSVMVDTSEHVRSSYVGNDAVAMRGVLKIMYVMSRGQVMDWNAFYEVLNHIFYNVLRVDTTQHPLIYSEPVLYPRDLREHMMRVFFETFQFPAVVIFPSAVMSLVNAGLSTGLVVEIGEGMAYVVPIHDGEIIVRAVNKLPLAGIDVNESLKTNLMQEGHHIISSFSAQKEILRDIKEKLCYIAEDFQREMQNSYKTNIRRPYILPDGSKIEIGSARFMAPEILFQPGMMGYNCLSISQAIIDSVSKVPDELKKPFLQNIVLSGGSTKFPGFEKRLIKELEYMLPSLGKLIDSETKQKDLSKLKPQLVSYESQIQIPGTGGEDTCPKCGNKVYKGDAFCSQCGHKLIMQQIVPKTPANPSPLPDEFGAAEEFMDPDLEGTSASGGVIKTHSKGDRAISVFCGASKLGAMKNVFDSVKITREAYQANPQIIHQSILKRIFSLL
ncbi:MAG: zinc-ribbon domain-containing protein [Promethearchaeota archaeon]